MTAPAAADLFPDLCVIGAGSAGLTMTAAARAFGLSVVLIERGEMGGECLHTGCVPSKALIAAARHAAAIRKAAAFGVDAGPPQVDFARVHAHVHGVIAGIAPHDSQARFEGLGATVIRASARFVDARTIEAGGRRIRAKRIIVATGSRPLIPPIPGLSDLPFLTNESLFDLTALPRHLIVIGAGPIGLEMAQAFRRLGAAVTVVGRGAALGNDDPAFAAVVLDRLRAEGVDIRTGATITATERVGDDLAVVIGEGAAAERVVGSHLLVATGRTPAIEGLDLTAAGIVAGPKGIETDRALRTANRRVYAIGDVAASFRFTHWAGHQAGLVLRSILTHWPHRENRGAIAWATYTDPELAHVGLTEAQARERFGARVRVVSTPYAANDRARADLETEGQVRLILGPRGRLLGADMVGAGAGELAGLFALALAGRLGVGALAAMVVPYPTLAETAKRAATASYAGLLDRPVAAAFARLLRRMI